MFDIHLDIFEFENDILISASPSIFDRTGASSSSPFRLPFISPSPSVPSKNAQGTLTYHIDAARAVDEHTNALVSHSFPPPHHSSLAFTLFWIPLPSFLSLPFFDLVNATLASSSFHTRSSYQYHKKAYPHTEVHRPFLSWLCETNFLCFLFLFQGYKVVYESEVVKANLNPLWQPFRIGLYGMPPHLPLWCNVIIFFLFVCSFFTLSPLLLHLFNRTVQRKHRCWAANWVLGLGSIQK